MIGSSPGQNVVLGAILAIALLGIPVGLLWEEQRAVNLETALGNTHPQNHKSAPLPNGNVTGEPEASALDQSNDQEVRKHQRRELEIAERDLIAQEKMAFYTFGMMILTAFGVLLIWRTLRYTRTAADEARRAANAAVETVEATRDTVQVTRGIGEAQVRAYVSQPNVGVSFRHGYYAVSIECRNHGTSPARNVVCAFTIQEITPPPAAQHVAVGGFWLADIMPGSSAYSEQMPEEFMKAPTEWVRLTASTSNLAFITMMCLVGN